MRNKKGQISVEYIMVLGFIVFSLIGIISIGFYYSYSVSDRVKLNHVRNFGNEIVRNAENVYYSGEPAQITLTPYIPEGVRKIEIAEDHLIITVGTSSGETQMAFSSNVPIKTDIEGITPTEGVKKIVIYARSDGAEIVEG